MIQIKYNKIIKYTLREDKDLLTILHDLKMDSFLNIQNIKQLSIWFEKLDNNLWSIMEFRKEFAKLLSGKSKFQSIFWSTRGFSKKESEEKAKVFSSSASKTSHNNRTPEERVILAKKANKKRVEQMKELAVSNPQKLKEQLSTTIEYYLAKGMTQEEAAIALKERQSTFSKKKMIEKYGEKKGLKKVQERNKKWFKSLKENNDWDELSEKKAVTLEKSILKYGLIDGPIKYKKWIEETKQNLKNFQRKYGIDEGLEKYLETNKKKGYYHTKEYYLETYGDEVGYIKWQERMNKIRVNTGDASKESLKIFEPILNEFKNKFSCYLGFEKYNEWYIWDNDLKKQYRYDFTLRESKIIIEYNGETFHPHKEKLTESEWNSWESPFSKEDANTVFKKDRHKINVAKEAGFKILEIWSSDSIEYNLNIVREFILKNS